VRAATDVTGFGLLGHLGNVLAASGVGAELAFDAIPLFPRVLALATAGAIPGGTQRNLEAAGADWAPDLTPTERLVVADAQTSGGLLLSAPPDRANALLDALRSGPSPAAAIIGRITADPGSGSAGARPPGERDPLDPGEDERTGARRRPAVPVVLSRRGNEYVVVAHRLKTFGREDILVGGCRSPVS